MASTLIYRASRRFLRYSLPSSAPSIESPSPSIFNPLISTQPSMNLNPSQNPSLNPFRQSHLQFSNFEFCKSVRSLSNFQLVQNISTSPSSLGEGSEENKNEGGNASRGDVSWIELYLPRQVQPYARLARLDKPIGTWLLLWPCIW